MNSSSTYFRWLTIAALADWLIIRTLTRVGIFIPKTPFFVRVYQTFTEFGLFAGTFASLLASGAMVWIAWQTWHYRANKYLAGCLGILAGLSLVFLIVPPGGWLLLLAHLVFLGCIIGLGTGLILQRPLLLLPIGAFLFGGLYQALPTLYELASRPGPPPLVGWVFNLGELFVVGSGIVFWWYWGKGSSRRTWILAAIPVVLFSGIASFAPAMTGIISIWSIGLTLYLPWPFYAVSLWLTGVTLIELFRRGDTKLGLGIMLLAAGGYAPQLSSQIFFGLIGLWLFVEVKESTANITEAYPRQLATQSLSK